MCDKFVRIRLPKLFRRHSSEQIPNTRQSPPKSCHSAPKDSAPSLIASDTFSIQSASILDKVVEEESLEIDDDGDLPIRATYNKSPAVSANPEVLVPQRQHDFEHHILSSQKAAQQPVVIIEAPSPPSIYETPSLPLQFNPHISFVDDLPTPATSQLAEEPESHGFSYISQDPVLLTPSSLNPPPESSEPSGDYFAEVSWDSEPPAMSRRKIWIKRPGASPTLVQVSQDDMVDDVRDMVLRKYANSLGRTFDAPDVVIRISPRERSQQVTERVLNPEESICALIDAYFPGGQSVDEALLVEVPPRRTPRLSPRLGDHTNGYHALENHRPAENEGDYFPPMPPVGSPLPLLTAIPADSNRPILNNFHAPHSMAILETGQLAPLPSPRERRTARPRVGRQHTSSPTIISGSITRTRPRGMEVDLRNVTNAIPTPPPLPTPPAPGPDNATRALSTKASTPPIDQSSSPRPTKTRRPRKTSVGSGHRPQPDGRKASEKIQTYSFLEGVVPPINVLIVEDNPINLRILEAFAKRLKVRWRTAMNGRDAVLRWKTGGFHLVLMDIQLPIMSGLEATKEIRRLERVNGIGVFARSDEDNSGSPSSPAVNGNGTNGATETEGQAVVANGVPHSAHDDDKLGDSIFKSPVIIVALTASSLQSDRREALAAGCNDFLTKPVSFDWLERKVMEWGCMQALIDFDGWRKWKDLAADEEKEREKGKTESGKGKGAKTVGRKTGAGSAAPGGAAASVAAVGA